MGAARDSDRIRILRAQFRAAPAWSSICGETQRADQTLVHRLEPDDVLAVGQHDAADRDLFHLADGLADHREGVVADLAVRP